MFGAPLVGVLRAVHLVARRLEATANRRARVRDADAVRLLLPTHRSPQDPVGWREPHARQGVGAGAIITMGFYE